MSWFDYSVVDVFEDEFRDCKAERLERRLGSIERSRRAPKGCFCVFERAERRSLDDGM